MKMIEIRIDHLKKRSFLSVSAMILMALVSYHFYKMSPDNGFEWRFLITAGLGYLALLSSSFHLLIWLYRVMYDEPRGDEEEC